MTQDRHLKLTPTAWYLASYLTSPSSSALNYEVGIITLLYPPKEVLKRTKRNNEHKTLGTALVICQMLTKPAAFIISMRLESRGAEGKRKFYLIHIFTVTSCCPK